jgi:hypothetical protein
MSYPPSKRPYKHEYKMQKKRDEHEDRMERQRARRKIDRDKGRAARRGKDVAHVKALSKGGTNKDGVRLESPSKNRSFRRNKDSSMK